MTEPGKHRRFSKTVKDKDETVPTRYQTMTNDESYDSFKEACSEEVTAVMKGKAKEMVDIVSRHPDTADRQKRLRYAEQVLPNKFPSKTWWLAQRPAEVKPMHDHTTGLCKVRTSQLNPNILTR